MADSPAWARSCEQCKKYVIGENGEVSTYPGRYEHGRLIEVPMLRSEYRSDPPCRSCPKAEDREPIPLETEHDPFDGWFWDVLMLYDECRAVNDFAGIDPLMRMAFAELYRSEKRTERSTVVDAVRSGIASLFARC